jgi:hypothetical protein
MRQVERQIERIDLPDNQWWDVFTVCSRGMRKAFRKAALGIVSGGLDVNGTSIDLSNPDALRLVAMSHPERLELNRVDDAYLLLGTKAYSFSDEISLDVIDNLPDSVVSLVVARLTELYAEPSEEEAKKAI